MVAFKRAMASSILWKEKASSEDDILYCVVRNALRSLLYENFWSIMHAASSNFSDAEKAVRRVAVALGRGAPTSLAPVTLSEHVRTRTFCPLNTSCFYISDGLYASEVFEAPYRIREASCFFISDASPSAHLLLPSTMFSPSSRIAGRNADFHRR
jgi:hypothetical protein